MRARTIDFWEPWNDIRQQPRQQHPSVRERACLDCRRSSRSEAVRNLQPLAGYATQSQVL